MDEDIVLVLELLVELLLVKLEWWLERGERGLGFFWLFFWNKKYFIFLRRGRYLFGGFFIEIKIKIRIKVIKWN